MTAAAGELYRAFERRLAQRIPVGKAILARGPDLFRAIGFRLAARSRESQLAAFRRSRTTADLFDFSRRIFGPCQERAEILRFLEYAEVTKPRRVCEIGTATGGTSFLLAQGLSTCRMAIGIDLYVKNRSQLRLFSRPSQELHFYSGSSRSARILRQVERALDGELLDVLFIDGDHSYRGAKLDFLNYRRFVRNGGIIAFHDIVEGETTEGASRAWVGGVPRLWREVRALYPHVEFVHDPRSHGFGIGAIRYDSSRDEIST